MSEVTFDVDDPGIADGGEHGAVNELGPIVIALLKGVVHRSTDQTRWIALGRMQAQIRDYVRYLGLELFVDDAEGYAFLRSVSAGETTTSDAEELPRLVSRRPLSFNVSLLLALLRKRLAEHDATGGDARLVLTRSDIVDLVAVFQPDTTNEAKLIDRVDTDITKVVDLGFLHRLATQTRRGDDPTFEVRRILKAFVDAQWLGELDARLAEYRATLDGTLAPGAEPGPSDV